MSNNIYPERSLWSKLGVLIPVFIFILIHSGTALWWASTVTTKIDNLGVKFDEKVRDINDKININSIDKYSKTQALADFATRDQRISSLEKQQDVLSRQFDTQLGEVKQLIQQLNNKFDTFIITYYQYDKPKK